MIQDVLPMFDMTSTWPEGYAEGLEGLDGFKVLGFDTETDDLSPFKHNTHMLSCAFSPAAKMARGIVVVHQGHKLTVEEYKKIHNLLTNPDIIIVGHNLKFDVNWVKMKLGIDVKCSLFDTQYAQYLLDENRRGNSLENLAQIYDDLRDYKANINRNKLYMYTKDDLLIYNCKDADASRRLVDFFVPKLRDNNLLPIFTTGMRVLPILSRMETRGAYFDQAWAAKAKDEIFGTMVKSRMEMKEIVKSPFDPDSPQELASILYGELKFICNRFTDKDKPSTDLEAIGYLYDQVVSDQQYKFLDTALRYKKAAKLITTYFQPIPQWIEYDGRVHTTYYLGKSYGEDQESRGGTVTGRLSSSKPNLQNVPRDSLIRGMFAATPGYTMLDMDFNQLELRVAAFLAQEPVMMQAFEEGRDIHTAVMSDLKKIPYDELVERLKVEPELKNERVAIKRINFGILYGVQAARLQRLLKIELDIDFPLEMCESVIQEWLAKYTKVVKMMNNLKAQAVGYGYVGMPLGQRRRLPDASFSTGPGRRALRQAINFPVQSFASWICFLGMINIDQYFKDNPQLDGHIVLQVHDSINPEIKSEMLNDRVVQEIKNKLEVDTREFLKEYFNVNFNVPLSVSAKIGERWQ